MSFQQSILNCGCLLAQRYTDKNHKTVTIYRVELWNYGVRTVKLRNNQNIKKLIPLNTRPIAEHRHQWADTCENHDCPGVEYNQKLYTPSFEGAKLIDENRR